MTFIENQIKWILLISGAITCTMFYAIVAPEAALMKMFGASLSGPLAEIIVRSWGVLITLTGALLLFAAFNTQHRSILMVIASISKTAFIALVLIFGGEYMDKAGSAVVFDSVVVVVFLIYLLGSKK